MLPSARKAEAAGKQRKSKAVGRAEMRRQHASNPRRADADAQNHWTSLELHGAKGNLLALNAGVRVTAGEFVQEDEVRAGVGLHRGPGRLHRPLDRRPQLRVGEPHVVPHRPPAGRDE